MSGHVGWDDERCLCKCHMYHNPRPGVSRIDPIAAVFACDVCRHLHCLALSSHEPGSPPA
jgi:hypothetical protein